MSFQHNPHTFLGIKSKFRLACFPPVHNTSGYYKFEKKIKARCYLWQSLYTPLYWHNFWDRPAQPMIYQTAQPQPGMAAQCFLTIIFFWNMFSVNLWPYFCRLGMSGSNICQSCHYWRTYICVCSCICKREREHSCKYSCMCTETPCRVQPAITNTSEAHFELSLTDYRLRVTFLSISFNP